MTAIAPLAGVPQPALFSQASVTSFDSDAVAFSMLLPSAAAVSYQPDQDDAMSETPKPGMVAMPLAEVDVLAELSYLTSFDTAASAVANSTISANSSVSALQPLANSLSSQESVVADMPGSPVTVPQRPMSIQDHCSKRAAPRPKINKEGEAAEHKIVSASSEKTDTVSVQADSTQTGPSATSIFQIMASQQGFPTLSPIDNAAEFATSAAKHSGQKTSRMEKIVQIRLPQSLPAQVAMPFVGDRMEPVEGKERFQRGEPMLGTFGLAGLTANGIPLHLDAISPAPHFVAETMALSDVAPPDHVERTLDFAREDIWLDQLARDIFSAGTARDRISFRLSPQHLGQLDVGLSHSEAGLTVQMTASNDAARQILTNAQPRLLDEMKGQGVRVVETRISSEAFDQGSRQHGRSDEQSRRPELIEIERKDTELAQTEPLSPSNGRFA